MILRVVKDDQEVFLRAIAWLLLTSIVAGLAGCHPPPPRIQVPDRAEGNPNQTLQRDPVKPLPPSATQQSRLEGVQAPAVAPEPPMPLAVSQEYIDAYDRVGRPRLLVLIDRASAATPAMVAGDYDLIERVVRDTLSAGGQVATVPQATVAEKLTAQQIADLLSNNGSALSDAAAALHADVLVDLRLAPAGEQMQITATARNTRDGQQIATAVATAPAVSARRQIDFTGRLLAERLISSLAEAWDQMSQPPPASAPATTQSA